MDTQFTVYGRRLASLGLTTTAALAALCALAAPSWAGLISTKTSAAVSAIGVDPSNGPTVTITAQVKPGLLITPKGPVKFTSSTTGFTATGTLSNCLLSFAPCEASVTVPESGLDQGANNFENQFVVTYTGDPLTAPSSARVEFDTPFEQDCATGGFCSNSGSSEDGSAFLSVEQNNNSGAPESIAITFDNVPLSCTTPGTGATAIWESTGATQDKTIEYESIGAAGFAAEQAHPISDGSGGYFCFSGPTTFTTASGSAATLEPDGSYQGQLPACTVIGEGDVSNPPCVLYGSYCPYESPNAGTYRTTVVVPPGEPRGTN